MNELLQELTPYIITILGIVLTYLASKARAYFDSKIDAENQFKIYNFIEATVAYVEMLGVDLDSEAKLSLAKEKILSFANEKGISITETELEVLIQAFVKGLKDSDTEIKKESE